MKNNLTHSEAASVFNKDESRVNWHDETLWFVREKRDKQAFMTDDWEQLREAASKIKDNVLSDMHRYLEQFESNALKNGIIVHWAADAAEHNKIVHSIMQKNGINQIVKSKSMLTEECHLNEYLAQKGVNVIDSDLGERIVQLRNEPPSHIVLPAIHLKKSDVSTTFNEHLGTEKGNNDPQYLTEAARLHLRDVFLTRKAALTGVNFAIAETGEFVVCTNEGNADMGVHLADVQISCMGMEKLIPERKHLGVFLRLLARSATGQPITTFSSHFKKPREGKEIHLVIVDNGRSNQLGRPDFRNSLKCIRCGACLNTCPVYRRSGGHSYHVSTPGPIGTVLAPNLDKKANSDLPTACTLCMSCTNVCPVKIDLDKQIYAWRQELTKDGYTSIVKTAVMKAAGTVLGSPSMYAATTKMATFAMKKMPFLVNNSMNVWYKNREMMTPPEETFKEWYRKNKKQKP
ncbi:lactate utilization protein B [Flavobacterium sp.]|uniref:lactate utilization protein B n=1 Tax=Flavobacterium sp. TaxID=239 RepID=UPI002C942225|nr:lactate utilization protein B [Flavobacterium sp.]HSD08434.1 lactate utilization protein B [Flavobacterium sp.]